MPSVSNYSLFHRQAASHPSLIAVELESNLEKQLKIVPPVAVDSLQQLKALPESNQVGEIYFN